MTTQPEKTFRAGACSASVFFNERKTDSGSIKLPSIAFSCRYKDEASNTWKDAASMSPNEVARALIVLRNAMDYCLLKETEPVKDSTQE